MTGKTCYGAVQAFLREVESDIQKQLPSFNVAGLVGANIDIFHKNPSHQRAMLAALEKPYLTSISISGRVFMQSASAAVEKVTMNVRDIEAALKDVDNAVINTNQAAQDIA